MRRPLPPPAPGESAVNALPPVALALFLAIALVEAALSLAQAGLVGGPTGIGWRVRALEWAAFSPAVQEAVADGLRTPDLLRRYVAYAFVHGGAVHALFGGALLLALGKFVGEALGGAAVLAAFLVATVAGALLFGALAAGTQPLFGAYPGVYGLIGAFTFVLWTRIGARGGDRLQRLQAFRLIGALLAIQLAFALLFGGDRTWIADVGGFAAGFFVAPLAAPGGLLALRDRLRG